MKEGTDAEHTSTAGITKIWKGKYKEKEVALKILSVHRDDSQAPTLESVSMSRNSQTRHFFGLG